MSTHNPLLSVTIITGFLGAGKTTLLQNLFNSTNSLRFAIIENEFGDHSIDGFLLSRSDQLLFELTRGCVCCSIRNDLIEVFNSLITRRAEIDHVIIETTGLADPGPIMKIFDMPHIQKSLTMNGVVTVVDAAHLYQSLADTSICQAQIIYADLIMINKIDTINEHEQSTIETHLRQMNPMAHIMSTSYAQVDTEMILNPRLYRSQLDEFHSEVSPTMSHTHHSKNMQSVAVEVEGVLNVRKLDLWLGSLVRNQEFNIVRMKGMIAISNDPRRFIFHAVRSVIDVKPDRLWEDETPWSRIIFIASYLDEEYLRQGLLSCVE